MKSFALAFVILGLLGVVADMAAADDIRRETVRFAPGESSARISGSITGHDSVEYRLEARAGQAMRVTFSPSSSSAYFNIFEPGRRPGDQAMYIGSSEGNEFTETLPADGTYTVQVYLYRNAARRGERADYEIEIAVSETAARGPDFADGLSGGPDFWRVTADSLNLRRWPTTRDEVVGSFADGAILRNLGCRMSDGSRWCRVRSAEGAGPEGWVDGRYLAEAPPPDAPITDARKPGTPYNATGDIDCSFAGDQTIKSCGFGVIRSVPGYATVDITFPDGFKRTLIFNGEIVRSPQTNNVAAAREREGDDWRITVDGSERYLVPDAVINGG